MTMSLKDKLSDPNPDPKEEDAIIGAFVRKQAREDLRARWTEQLDREHNVQRTVGPAEKTAPQPARGAKIRQLIWGLAAAAAVALLLIVFVPALTAADLQQLAAKYQTESPLDNYRSGGDTPLDSLRSVGAKQITAKKFTAAATTGTILLSQPGTSPEDLLFLGFADLNAGNANAAESSFRQLQQSGSVYRAEATFFLALSLIAQDQTAEARKELASIPREGSGTYFGKAQDLLDAR